MSLLFDPPPKFEIPLSYGSDLRVVFKNKVPGSAPSVYEDFPEGTSAVFVLGKPGSEVVSVDAVIDGAVAFVRVESGVLDSVKSGTIWRFVVSRGVDDLTAVNGRVVRSDGN